MTKALTLPKWSDALLSIYKTPEQKRYCQKISPNVKTTINHLRKIVRVLAQKHLIKITPTKKIKRISLTDKGKEVATALLNLKTAINEN